MNWLQKIFGIFGSGSAAGGNPFANFFQAIAQAFGFGSKESAKPDTGDKQAVKRLQEDLANDGLYPATGKYAQDGIAGDVTRHALRLRDEQGYAEQYMETALEKDALKAADVMKIQAAMNKIDPENTVAVNGRLNNETRDNISRYLNDHQDAKTSEVVVESAAPKKGFDRTLSDITESLRSKRDNALAPAPSTGPRAGGSAQSLLNLIGEHESKQNYNAIWPKSGGNGTDFTKMTVNEVLAYQDQYVRDGSKSSAVGRYQIIRGTMRGLVKDMNLSGDEMFDPAMQDKMAMRLLEQRGLSKFRDGKISETQFMNNIAKEWASMPKADGRGHYDGDGLNKVGVDTKPVLAALGNIKEGPSTSTALASNQGTAPMVLAATKSDIVDFGRKVVVDKLEGMQNAAERLGLDKAFATAGTMYAQAGQDLEQQQQVQLASTDPKQQMGMALG